MPFEPQKASEFTDAGTVSRASISHTEKGMAHFAGTAGNGKQCRHCPHFGPIAEKSKKKYCHQFIRLTGDSKKVITGLASACRYFDEPLPS